jgi:hypothetical protein
MEDIYIQKTNPNSLFLFILDDKNQWCFFCKDGYHIHISNWEECFIQHQIHSLSISKYQSTFHQFHHILKKILDSHFSKKLKKIYKKIKLKTHFFFQPKENDILIYLYPLIKIHKKFLKHELLSDEKMKMEQEKMFQSFYMEFQLLQNQFQNTNYSTTLLKDWIQIFLIYKSEFFENPEQTIKMLRKICYQYMITHKLNHISFKSFDFSKMMISLYLWSEWSEKLFFIYQDDLYKIDTFDKIVMTCLDLFFIHDDLYDSNEINQIHIYDLQSSKYHLKTCSNDLFLQLKEIHPILRPNFLYTYFSKS